MFIYFCSFGRLQVFHDGFMHQLFPAAHSFMVDFYAEINRLMLLNLWNHHLLLPLHSFTDADPASTVSTVELGSLQQTRLIGGLQLVLGRLKWFICKGKPGRDLGVTGADIPLCCRLWHQRPSSYVASWTTRIGGS